jgi:hypothetical protein
MILSSLFVLNIHKIVAPGETLIKSGSLYVIFNVLLLATKQATFSLFTFLHILFLLLIIMLGERVETILTIVVLLVMNGTSLMKEQYNKKILYLSLLTLFILGIIAGFMRNKSVYSFESILVSFYANQTVCDVLYVFLCSAEYYLQHGATIEVLGNAFLGGLFPGEYYGVSSKYFHGTFLRENFGHNAGGGLFFSEGMLAFGAFGVLLYMFLMAIFIKYIFTHKGRLYTTWFLLLMVLMCRIMWYGFIYVHKPFIVLFVIIVCINTYLKNNSQFLASNSKNILLSNPFIH